MKKDNTNQSTFAEKHPKLNMLLGLFLIGVIIFVGLCVLKIVFSFLGKGFSWMASWISDVGSNLDAVVIVAIISGVISILGIVISSIVAKSLDYKRTRREYLAKKREQPYGEFIDMIYKIQQSSKPGKQYPKDEMVEDILRFSKSITLWGSPKVVSNWVKFKEIAMNGNNKGIENLLITEKLMNDMRKDLGLPRVKKGNLLAFFIHDIKDAIKNQHIK